MDNVFKREILKRAKKKSTIRQEVVQVVYSNGFQRKNSDWATCLNLDILYSYDKIVSVRMFSDLHVSCRAIY